MLELIFLSPLLVVVGLAALTRYAVCRRPFTAVGWAIFAAFSAGAFFLPLTMGVWIPDFVGTSRTLARATTASGYSFRVIQVWNRIDFYTTTLYVTAPDGSTTGPLLDGDDAKSWKVPIVIDEANRLATVTLSGGRPKVVAW